MKEDITITRKNYIDLLRIISIILVIYNHTRTRGFELFLVTEDKVSYGLSFAMYPFCKIAVPIFFMISGVTLLAKKENIKYLYKKRILKHFIIILFFGTLQFLRYVRVGKVALSLKVWFTSVYSTPILETYWFLYLYLGFLIILPLLRKMITVMEKQDYIYLFVLCMVFWLLYYIGCFTGYFPNANIFSFSIVVFYPLMGYGIDKYLENIKVSRLLFITLLSEGLAILSGIFYIRKFPDNLTEMINVFQLFIPLLAINIFMIFKVGFKGKKSRLVSKIGKSVFGIYLIEDIVRNQIEKVICKMNFNFIGSEFIFCMLYVIISFTISLLLVGSLIYFIRRKK